MIDAPKICIVGGSIWGNRGAEAMVTTCIGHLRRKWPKARFVVLSYLPSADRNLVNDPTISIVSSTPGGVVLLTLGALIVRLFRSLRIVVPDRLIPRGIREIRSSHVMVDVFGVSFVDGREAFLPFNILALAPALLCGVPIVKLSQALGPFDNPVNRLCAKLTLTKCEQIFARGKRTAENLTSLGLPAAKFAVSSDLAFVYEPQFCITSENAARTAELHHRLRCVRTNGNSLVAVCPSSVVFKKANRRGIDYIGMLADIANEALEAHFEVIIMPHATREGLTTMRNNDLPVIHQLKARLTQECGHEKMQRLHFVDYDLNTADIRSILELTELVVTSRFHAMIAALSLGVPPLVLGWSHKYAEILEHFRLEDACFDIENLESNKLTAQLRAMLMPSFRQGWEHTAFLSAIQSNSMDQIRYVTSLIERVIPPQR